MQAKSLLFRAIGLIALAMPLAIHAETLTFSATGSGFESSGTLTVSTTSTPGVFDVTNVTGEIDGTAITGLIPGSYDASNPTTISNGDFSFDNLFYSPAPYFDYNGIGFNVGTSGYQFNLFYDSTANGGLGSYETWDSNNVNLVLDSFTISVAPTPEPSSLLLLGTGVIAAAGVLRRRFV